MASIRNVFVRDVFFSPNSETSRKRIRRQNRIDVKILRDRSLKTREKKIIFNRSSSVSGGFLDDSTQPCVSSPRTFRYKIDFPFVPITDGTVIVSYAVAVLSIYKKKNRLG